MADDNDTVTAGRSGFRPSHPGRLIRRNLDALGVTVEGFATHIGVSRQTAHNIISGRSAVTAETAAKLGRAFKSSTAFWLNMQAAHDAWSAERLPAVVNVRPLRAARASAGTALSAKKAAVRTVAGLRKRG